MRDTATVCRARAHGLREGCVPDELLPGVRVPRLDGVGGRRVDALHQHHNLRLRILQPRLRYSTNRSVLSHPQLLTPRASVFGRGGIEAQTQADQQSRVEIRAPEWSRATPMHGRLQTEPIRQPHQPCAAPSRTAPTPRRRRLAVPSAPVDICRPSTRYASASKTDLQRERLPLMKIGACRMSRCAAPVLGGVVPPQAPLRHKLLAACMTRKREVPAAEGIGGAVVAAVPIQRTLRPERLAAAASTHPHPQGDVRGRHGWRRGAEQQTEPVRSRHKGTGQLKDRQADEFQMRSAASRREASHVSQ